MLVTELLALEMQQMLHGIPQLPLFCSLRGESEREAVQTKVLREPLRANLQRERQHIITLHENQVNERLNQESRATHPLNGGRVFAKPIRSFKLKDASHVTQLLEMRLEL
ncbi:hypothetical protein ATCC90586_010847 [Pythium insidiosum]|nr:hypothetical protein ATCC90586_010847 [Pythium insidiosum]